MVLPEITESLERRQFKKICHCDSYALKDLGQIKKETELFLELHNKFQIIFFSRKAKIYYIYNVQ